jgi:hypothetical protein
MRQRQLKIQKERLGVDFKKLNLIEVVFVIKKIIQRETIEEPQFKT